MFRLRCTVEAGVFSHERLVRFVDASGQQLSALVDADAVQEADGTGWVGVKYRVAQGARTLVALPSDGARVWVPSDALQPQVG
jgi:hypothetical protein